MSAAPHGTLRRFGADATAVLVGSVLSLLVTFILTPLQLRGMGPEAYGIVAVMASMVSYLGFLDLGLGRALTRFIPLYGARGRPERAGEMVFVAAVLSVTLGSAAGLAVAAAAPVLARRAFDISPVLQGQAASAFRLGGLLVPLFLLQNVAAGVGRALGLFKHVAVIGFATMAVVNVVWAIVASRPDAVEAVAQVHVLAVGASVVAWIVVIRRRPDRPRITPSAWRSTAGELLRFGGLTSVANVGWLLMSSADKLVLASLVPAVRLPLYVIPFSLAMRITVVCTAATTVALPRLAATSDADLGPDMDTARVGGTVAVVTGALTSGLVWGGGSLLAVWIGKGFARDAQSTLVLLSLGFGVLAVGSLDHIRLDARGHARATAVNALLAAGVGLTGLVAGAAWRGVPGAAGGMALGLALHGILNAARASALEGIAAASHLRRLLSSWPALFAAGGSAWLLTGGAGVPALGRLLAVGGAVVGVSVLALARALRSP